MLTALEQAKRTARGSSPSTRCPRRGSCGSRTRSGCAGCSARARALADLFLQIRVNGDLALFQCAQPRCSLERRTRSTTRFIAAHTDGFEAFADARARDRLGRRRRRRPASTPPSSTRRCAPGRAPQRTHHRVLGDGPHPAPQRGARPSARSSTSCCCAATSAGPAPASARCAATATCRATAPWASTSSPTAAFLDALGDRVRLRAAAATTATTPSRRSAAMRDGRVDVFVRAWAATSCARQPGHRR